MRLKILFWILFVLVFGSIIALGLFFQESNFYLFIAFEGIAILSILLFFVFYRMLLRPYEVIKNGMDLLRQQDFSSRLCPVGYKESDELIHVFNKMIDQLKNERLHVREQNHFLDLLIKDSPQGLIVLDFDNRITQINPSGLRLLGLESSQNVIGKKLENSGLSLAKVLSELKEGEDEVIRTSGIILYRCVRSSFMDRGFVHPFILIEELTHEILNIEKKSYENIIRMIAHEVNNSIAAVSSTLNVISDSLEQDLSSELSDVLPAVNASCERCKHLSQFITNFADVVKIPLPHLTQTDLNVLAYSVKNLSDFGSKKKNIKITLLLSDSPCFVHADSIQMEQVLVNLIKNASESILENGEIRIITQKYPLQMIVEDNGPGISEEVRKKLFTPFFTTKPKGQGIGLLFIREVLMNHGFSFSFMTEKDGKTRFRIFLNSKK